MLTAFCPGSVRICQSIREWKVRRQIQVITAEYTRSFQVNDYAGFQDSSRVECASEAVLMAREVSCLDFVATEVPFWRSRPL